MKPLDAIIMIVIVAVCTFITRLIPFVLFGRQGGEPPKVIRRIGKVLPPAVMAVLVVYCLKNTSFTTAAGFLPQLIAVAVVALVHLWRKNTIVSILVGTACYMALVQLRIF